MSNTEAYGASPIKRQRATRDEMEERAEFLLDYAAEHGPVTVRQLFYRAVAEGLPGIEKTEDGYKKIQRQVLDLRREGRMPYGDIADATRWARKPTTYNSVAEALHNTARFYRKSLWTNADSVVEIWCEKDALAGVIFPVTAENDVRLMVTRGFSSETFCFEAVESYVDDPRLLIVYYLGDFDRSGRDAANALKEKLERFAKQRDVTVYFEQLAITEEDIIDFDEDTDELEVSVGPRLQHLTLPTREHKRNSEADKKWPYAFACELDAIEPDDLRALVRNAIETELPVDKLRILKIAEESEREGMMSFFAGWKEQNPE